MIDRRATGSILVPSSATLGCHQLLGALAGPDDEVVFTPSIWSSDVAPASGPVPRRPTPTSAGETRLR